MDIFIGDNPMHKCGQTPKDCFLSCFNMSHGNKKKLRQLNPWLQYVEVKVVAKIESMHYITESVACNIEGMMYNKYVSKGKKTLNIDIPSHSERFLQKNQHLFSFEECDEVFEW